LVLRSFKRQGRKKTALARASFGFGKNGETLYDNLLPANLTAEWLGEEGNQGKHFPGYARMLKVRGTDKGESRYSWTIDFAARRAKAREEMQPFLDEAASSKAAVVDLKIQLKQSKTNKAEKEVLAEQLVQIKEQEKAARDLETKAANIDAAVFDLKAVNPNAVTKNDNRSTLEIIALA
jgi:type I restriction enzyme M protein